MFQAILAQIRALAAIVHLTLAAILLTLAPAAYADCHHNERDIFWFNKSGSTYLHFEAFLNTYGDPAAKLAGARTLLSGGANPNVITIEGITPLMYAAKTNFLEMASLLIANGANVNARSNDGNTAMDLAILKGHTQMQSLLRAHGGKCRENC